MSDSKTPKVGHVRFLKTPKSDMSDSALENF